MTPSNPQEPRDPVAVAFVGGDVEQMDWRYLVVAAAARAARAGVASGEARPVRRERALRDLRAADIYYEAAIQSAPDLSDDDVAAIRWRQVDLRSRMGDVARAMELVREYVLDADHGPRAAALGQALTWPRIDPAMARLRSRGATREEVREWLQLARAAFVPGVTEDVDELVGRVATVDLPLARRMVDDEIDHAERELRRGHLLSQRQEEAVASRIGQVCLASVSSEGFAGSSLEVQLRATMRAVRVLDDGVRCRARLSHDAMAQLQACWLAAYDTDDVGEVVGALAPLVRDGSATAAVMSADLLAFSTIGSWAGMEPMEMELAEAQVRSAVERAIMTYQGVRSATFVDGGPSALTESLDEAIVHRLLEVRQLSNPTARLALAVASVDELCAALGIPVPPGCVEGYLAATAAVRSQSAQVNAEGADLVADLTDDEIRLVLQSQEGCGDAVLHLLRSEIGRRVHGGGWQHLHALVVATPDGAGVVQHQWVAEVLQQALANGAVPDDRRSRVATDLVRAALLSALHGCRQLPLSHEDELSMPPPPMLGGIPLPHAPPSVLAWVRRRFSDVDIAREALRLIDDVATSPPPGVRAGSLVDVLQEVARAVDGAAPADEADPIDRERLWTAAHRAVRALEAAHPGDGHAESYLEELWDWGLTRQVAGFTGVPEEQLVPPADLGRTPQEPGPERVRKRRLAVGDLTGAFGAFAAGPWSLAAAEAFGAELSAHGVEVPLPSASQWLRPFVPGPDAFRARRARRGPTASTAKAPGSTGGEVRGHDGATAPRVRAPRWQRPSRPDGGTPRL